MKKVLLFITFLTISFKLIAQNVDSSNVLKKDTITSIDHIDSSPDFPGGQRKFNEYIKKNLKFSKFDLDNHISGINFVRFVIEKDGSLTNIQCLRACSPDSEQEAIRLIKDSPKWIPAISGGKPCRVMFTVPIRFEPPSN